MALDKYTGARIEISGSGLLGLDLEAADIEVERQTNAIEQHTLAKGMGGFSDGVGKTMVRVNRGVLATGAQMPANLMALTQVDVSIYAAGLIMRGQFVILGDTFKKATDSNASLSFNMTSGYLDWQT